MLAIAVIAARKHNGEEDYQFGWAMIIYFVEIAVFGATELIVGYLRRERPAA